MTLQERLVSEAIEKYLGKNTEPDDAWHTSIYEEKANKLKPIILHTIEQTIKEGVEVVGGMPRKRMFKYGTTELTDEWYIDLTDTQHALRGIIG